MIRPCPARIVAVSQLVLDVLEDLTARPPECLSLAECDFTALLITDRSDLLRILTLARAEMATLAPAVLVT